jgi:general stress protein YciG
MKRISDDDIARAVKAYNEGSTLKEAGALIGATVAVVRPRLSRAGVTIRVGGFGSIGPERRREIASMGGSSVAAENRAYSRDRALAAAAGRKGGRSSHHTFPQASE